MSNATKKQIEYVTQISNALGIKVPEDLTFDTANAFIQNHRQEFYRLQNDQTINLVKSNILITDIAREIGFTPVKVGKYYTLKEHDSVRIDTAKNCYWQNSVAGYGNGAKGGSVIDFMMNFTGRNAQEVTYELSQRVKQDNFQMKASAVSMSRQEKQTEKKGKLTLPEADVNMRRVYAYLLKTRLLEPNIVQEFVQNKMLYQDRHGNCVFVSRDKDGQPEFACLRGTSTQKRFVGDIANSDYQKGFYIDNGASKTIVTESVIDAMSVMGILQAKGINYHAYNYMPLAGVAKDESLMNKLKEKPVKELYLALDNDDGGRNAAEHIKELTSELEEADMFIHDAFPEYTKDWNEEIKYALNHNVDISTLDFFNEQFDDSRNRKLKEKLKENEKQIADEFAMESLEIEPELEL